MTMTMRQPIPRRVEERVNHPAHYGGADNPFEPIKIIKHYKLNFELGCVIKYVLRAELKGTPIEDLQKAAWYLQDEINERKRLEQGGDSTERPCTVASASPAITLHPVEGRPGWFYDPATTLEYRLRAFLPSDAVAPNTISTTLRHEHPVVDMMREALEVQPAESASQESITTEQVKVSTKSHHTCQECINPVEEPDDALCDQCHEKRWHRPKVRSVPAH